MKRYIVLYVLLSSLFVGCLGSEKVIYVCPDGSQVSNPDNCPSTTSTIMTTTTSTTSTTTSTTTISTTTTTTLAVACTINSDCGQRIEERVCYKGDVYIRFVTPVCMKPGTVESYCIQRISWSGASLLTEPTPFERCSHGCENGTCL